MLSISRGSCWTAPVSLAKTLVDTSTLGCWHTPKTGPTLSGRLLSAVGGHVHRWQPSAPLVRQLMVDARLVDICDCEFRQGKLPGLDVIETREESFFLEGTKLT